MSIKYIQLDIDDVLNTCVWSALAHLGIACSPSTYPTKYKHGDLWAAANELVCEERFTIQTFWDSFPRSFWSDCPKSEEFDWIINACERLVGRDNVQLLTSPTKCPECHAGKYEWIIRNCPAWLHRSYAISTRKQSCANHETLLIDDADHNIDKFRATRNGRGLLVPRPWNSLSGVETMPYLIEQFDRLFEVSTSDEASFTY